jgi:hypothetical protein
MKKAIVIILSSLIIMASLSGCGRSLAARYGQGVINDKTASNAEKETGSTNGRKLTIDDIKNLDDNKLTQQITGGEDTLNLDEAGLPDADLQELDNILNDKDPIADIPANVKVDK